VTFELGLLMLIGSLLFLILMLGEA